MQSLKNMGLTAGGLGDQLMQDMQNQMAARRKAGTAALNPLNLGDITQSSLGMAASILGFGNQEGPGGPLAKQMGLV